MNNNLFSKKSVNQHYNYDIQNVTVLSVRADTHCRVSLESCLGLYFLEAHVLPW